MDILLVGPVVALSMVANLFKRKKKIQNYKEILKRHRIKKAER